MEAERAQSPAKPRGLSGNALKLIAIAAMFIDHIGACVLETGMFGSPDVDKMVAFLRTESGRNWYLFDMGVLRTVGRLAFPIFCFLLVEGFLHTKDVKKYAARLFVFALISEVPFDYAFWGSPFFPNAQNVYFTLFIGLLVLIGYERYVQKPLLQGIVIVAGCGAAILLKTDYNMMGIVLILLFYVFRYNKKHQAVAAGILCAAESITNFGAAALAMIPIWMYNGTRGKENLKYLFYWFYPAHIVLLIIVRAIIFH